MARIVVSIPTSLTEDHQPIIQKALDDVEADEGGEVFVPDGVHMIGPANDATGPAGQFSLQLGNNVHLRLGRSTVLLRRFQGGGADRATIRNKNQNPNEPTQNIKVSGGTIARSTGGNNVGKHIGFQFANYVTLEDVRFEDVRDDWNAEFHDCDDVTISGVVMDSGEDQFEDGLHFSGGNRIAITNCIIRCGDDALTFVNNESCGPINDVVVSNCYLHSRAASALKIEVEEDGEDPSPPIRRVEISNIVAKSGVDDSLGNGIIILDKNEDFRVSDIEINGFWLDGEHSPGPPLIIGYARRVRLGRVVCWHPMSGISIEGSDDVELRDCVVDSPRFDGGGAVQCLSAAVTDPCTRIRIQGGLYRGANNTDFCIAIGANQAVDGFEVSNVEITGATLSGLVIANASNGIVTANNSHGNGAWGIREVSPGNNNVLIGNRVVGNASGGLTFVGAATEAIRNVAEAGVVVNDSGGFRQTIDGWMRQNVASGITTPEELSRNNFVAPQLEAGRFRAVRPGSVTGVVVTSTEACTAGSLTVTVFKNTGAAGQAGSSIGLSATLNTTAGNTLRRAVTQPQDAGAADMFNAGDELYIVVTTTGAPTPWAPTTADIRCALEIED